MTVPDNPRAIMMAQRQFSAASRPLRPSPLSSSSSVESSGSLVIPQEAPAGLALSGRIISATCYTPFTIGYRQKAGTDAWEFNPRRGSSALYDSLKHLASHSSGWRHTLVGWTGEIAELPEEAESYPNQHLQDSRTTTVGNPAPAFTDSAVAAPMVRSKSPANVPPPVPVVEGTGNRMTMKGDYSRKDEGGERVMIDQTRRADLQKVLDQKSLEAGWDEVKAVWIGDDEKAKVGDKEKVLGIPLTGMKHWLNYADQVLWPNFHYIMGQMSSPDETSTVRERKWWSDYVQFNTAFADTIMEVYKPGDIIWIHDYHLLLVPEMLRQRIGRDAYIGVFVHAPWPSSEIFRTLSSRKALLEGMLAANMVGFQSETYKQHFTSCCKRILGRTETYKDDDVTGVETSGSHCAVESMPIGLDIGKVLSAAMEPGIQRRMEKLKQRFGGRKIIVGRDRLDTVRGVVQKLRAFERFLEKYPQWINEVVLVQITSPSTLRQSASVSAKVSEHVAEINGRYGTLDYAPVQHYPQYVSPEDYFALLRAADVGLVTSVRDGMNTVSLEYIICQLESHGPVIVSEFTGTAESLTDAILVNPTNLNQVADELARCLSFSESEKADLHAKVFNYVRQHTAQSWNNTFLRKLFKELAQNQTHQLTPMLDREEMFAAYKAAKSRLFLFDYDGTLTPIVQDPEMAVPTDRVVRTLKRLAQEPENRVWIVSGRDQKFLGSWLGHIDELGLSAEHGCFMRHPNSAQWINLADEMDMSWQEVVQEVFQSYTERTTGSFIEKKHVAVTWHYRRADPEYGVHMAKLCKDELSKRLSSYEVEVMTGKANLEVRPRALNKGEIVRRLLKDSDESVPEFVMCTGDDTTDEDMFRVLNELEEGAAAAARGGVFPSHTSEEDGKRKLPEPDKVFSVTVGPSSKETAAKWHLPEPADVVESVALLVGIVSPEELQKGSGAGSPSL